MADDMFRVPLQRGMRVLDRSKFQKVVPIKAARVFENKDISHVRKSLEQGKFTLSHGSLSPVRDDPDTERARMGKKCLLLQPHVSLDKSGVSETAVEQSPIVAELVQQKLMSVIPYDLRLNYDSWSYHEIISAILPEDDLGEIPCGFNLVGHVAHLNLRDQYLKYKTLIAEILLDKNPCVKTVINKIDDVGEEDEFRTFKYEVLAGPDDLNVTTSSGNCTFKFDYGKVYWNSRLDTEHRRLVDMFAEGDVICDVMAGVGPFAIPAGKKGCFVWANDLNPCSYNSLVDNIQINKVQDYVLPFNEDGHTFIRTASAALAQEAREVQVISRPPRRSTGQKPQVLKTLYQPKIFQHFVMNLPATAITFLPNFIGVYPPEIRQVLGQDFRLPRIHVYCFSTKSADNVREGIEICEEISRQLKHPMLPGKIEDDDRVEIWDVRDVAPKKRMFCASFKLPAQVAFRESSN